MEEPLDIDLNHETLVHDLNNVFETIAEAAEVLSNDKHWKGLAATLSRSVTRGKRLLDAIPDSTPMLASVVEASIQSVNDYCMAARRARLRFVRQIAQDCHLPGTAKDWERVFVNLFLNSAQIMQKPGRIDIATLLADGNLSITISDNGPGIPTDILPRVFRPHVSTKTGGQTRSGLGLHIVASIVKKHSGRVTASNRERGSGAVFTISLPATA